MPPRFAYWTILIDDKPTAFRAREREELLPTFTQLKRTNQNVAVRWFSQGQLWDSPEAQRAAGRNPKFAGDKRGPDWRPGGAHKDPRDRFKKKNRPERAWSEGDASTRRERDTFGPPRQPQPWRDKPAGPPSGKLPTTGGAGRPWSDKPHAPARPWTTKPGDPSRPWSGKPRDPSKPWTGKPRDAPRPWTGKTRGPSKPWSAKPRGPTRPWGTKPGGPSKPWRDRPHDTDRKPFRPDGSTSRGPESGAPRKRRDDEPPDGS